MNHHLSGRAPPQPISQSSFNPFVCARDETQGRQRRAPETLTVFTGVSVSGKTSMVFGAIAAESQHLERTLTRIWSDEFALVWLAGWRSTAPIALDLTNRGATVAGT